MKDPEVVEAFERVLRYGLVAAYGTPERAFRREETNDGWCYWCAGTESAYEKFLAGWSAAVIEQQGADPLQGAADWLVKDCGVFDSVELASRLSIGYNRASRLLDAARKEQK